MAETTPETWGVSVDQVKALAPHITITDTEPAPGGDVPFTGNKEKHVAQAQVEAWIIDVAARVSLRIHRRSKVDTAMQATVNAAAHDLVLNGAGNYLVAAAFPAKAGLNDNTSYSAELWRRFTEGLDELEKAIADWIIDNETSTPIGSTSTIIGSFPEPIFGDDIAW